MKSEKRPKIPPIIAANNPTDMLQGEAALSTANESSVSQRADETLAIHADLAEKLLKQAQELCNKNGAQLLYLTLFGSTLYGTATPGKSDIDIRGIFLPSRESLALNSAPKSLHYSTTDSEQRNSANDVDIDLWSLQHWLIKLLPSGDIGALDVLFSPSHSACVLFKDKRLNAVFANPLRFIDTENSRAYAEYSLGQAKKYGIKGSRIGALKSVHKWLQKHCAKPEPSLRLNNILNQLAITCVDEKFCSLTTVQDEPALILCGKTHVGNIKVAEFIRRVENDMQRYGARAAEAEKNQGVDFKALSHALRALDQMEELFETGKINFPLKTREEILEVKNGKLSWQEVEDKILSRLATIDELRRSTNLQDSFDKCFAKKQILAAYGWHKSDCPDTAEINIFHKGFTIPSSTLSAIQDKLLTVEAEHNIKILYACESGSRGWGFASKDSDFDVRFIYVHRPEWYLSVAPEEKRDVLEFGIEKTKVGELDINGWELRKALKLFRQSNPPLLEWLSSPLIYKECGNLANMLREAAPTGTNSTRIWYHYNSMMTKSHARYWEKRPSIKAWFYVMRPLLAMRWIELKKNYPPMRFDLLLDGVIDCPKLRQAINELVLLKVQGTEQANFDPPVIISDFLEKESRRIATAPPFIPAEQSKVDLDAIFYEVLNSAW